MSLIDHLEELRYRILLTLFPWLVFVGIAFSQVSHIVDLIRPPLPLVILAPAEGFLVYLKLAVYTGTLAIMPVALYQLLAFAAPGLERHERRLVFFLLPVMFVLLIGGVLFGYTFVLPIVVKFFLSFTSESLQAMISIDRYVTFAAGIILPFGIIFQLPVVVFILAKLGLISAATMRRARGYALVGSLVIGAVLTPPDVISQALMALPLYGLYELSIWIAHFVSRRRQ